MTLVFLIAETPYSIYTCKNGITQLMYIPSAERTVDDGPNAMFSLIVVQIQMAAVVQIKRNLKR